MKLLCTGDFQLGAGTAYGRAPGDRLNDQREALLRIAEVAHEREVQAVVFLGDLGERRNPSVLELLAFDTFVDELQPDGPGGLELLMQAGNHDATGADVDSAVTLWSSRPGVRVWERPGTYYADRAVLAFLPWAHPGHLRARTGGKVQAHEHAEALVEIAAGLRHAERAPAEVPHVLFLHWALSGCQLPTGLPTSALTEPVLPLDDLLAQEWSAVVGGHVHLSQAPAQGVYVVGSPYTCDFGEAHAEHRALVLDTERPYDGEWVPLTDRPFVTLTRPLDPVTADVRDAVVRVRWQGTEEEARSLDIERLKQGLYERGAHKVYAVEVDVERQARARAEGLTAEVEDAHALELYIRTQEVPAPLAAAMRERHRLLEEEPF